MPDPAKRAEAANKMEAIAREYGFTAGVLFLAWPSRSENSSDMHEACGHSFGDEKVSDGSVVDVMGRSMPEAQVELFCADLRAKYRLYNKIDSGIKQ